MQLIREYLDSTARKYGVTKMGLFGSVARDEQVDDSDIDIAYEGQANIFIRIRMKAELEKLLGCKVDIIRLHKNMADTLFGREVEKDIIYDCPGCCSVEELDMILDKAEATSERGEYLTNEEALKVIKSW